jgi:hypothetical protein
MKRYRVLTKNDVYQRDASGTLAACPVGAVIDIASENHAAAMVNAGFIEVVIEEKKRRPTDG